MSLTMTEQILLLALWRLGDEATGVNIRQRFSDLTGRDVAFGTVYNNMDQLIRKGLPGRRKARPAPSGAGGPRSIIGLRPRAPRPWKTIDSFKSGSGREYRPAPF